MNRIAGIVWLLLIVPNVCMVDLVSIDIPNLQPESISWSDTQKAFFVGSMTQGTIHKVYMNGTYEAWVKEPLEATGGVLVVDRLDMILTGNFNKSLIAAFLGGAPSFTGWQTSLVVANLTTGDILANVDLTTVGDSLFHLASDITVDKHNNVYVSDTFGGQIWKFKSLDFHHPTVFMYSKKWSSPGGFGPNGIAVVPNNNGLYVTHVQKQKIYYVPLNKPTNFREVSFMNIPGVLGPDGSRFAPGGQYYYVCSNVANLIYQLTMEYPEEQPWVLRLTGVAMTPFSTPTAVTFQLPTNNTPYETAWANALPQFKLVQPDNAPLYKLDVWNYGS